MKELISAALRYQNQQLLVLNQQLLPAQEEWLHCQSPTQMVDIIRTLQVRGAPLIGVAAAVALAQYVEQGADQAAVQQAAAALKAARPTAVNLAHCLDRQLQAFAQTKNLAS